MSPVKNEIVDREAGGSNKRRRSSSPATHAETNTCKPLTEYVYYRIFNQDGAAETKYPINPDPGHINLSWISLDLIPPPYSPEGFSRFICAREVVELGVTGDIFSSNIAAERMPRWIDMDLSRWTSPDTPIRVLFRRYVPPSEVRSCTFMINAIETAKYTPGVIYKSADDTNAQFLPYEENEMFTSDCIIIWVRSPNNCETPAWRIKSSGGVIGFGHTKSFRVTKRNT